MACRTVAVFLAVAFAVAASAEPAPPPEALVGEMRFLEDHPASRSHVVIDLAPVGQAPFPLMLDTGAASSVVTPRLARSLGVSVRRTKSSPYRKRTRLGRDLLFWVDTSSSDTGSPVGWEYGLLGGDFLDDYVVEIDYPGRKVRFYDPDRYSVPESVEAPDERVVPFERSGVRILVEFDIEGRRARAMLDTGASGTGLLSGRLVEKAGVDVDSLPEAHEVYTTRGPLETRLLETERFALGGFGFGRIGFLVSPSGWYNIAGPTDSAIGHDVLGQFVVRIDYPNRRLWLKRGERLESTWHGVPWERARVDEFDLPIPEAEREAARAEAERSDREWVEEWKERQASRLFVEERGGWQVVEGHRRRRGPKPGEVWVTYEEMMRIRREREAGREPEAEQGSEP